MAAHGAHAAHGAQAARSRPLVELTGSFGSAPRRVIIDTDPGVDDCFALALALCSPQLDVLGITITHGNSSDVDQMARNACTLLELCKRPDVPVYLGARGPLERPIRGESGAIFHGPKGTGDVVAAPSSLEPIERVSDCLAHDFLAKTVAVRHPGEVSLVTLGPLTNVALAIGVVREFRTSIRSLHVMGGACFVPGNVSATAEFNVFCDPEAASDVLSRIRMPVPPVLCALDITHQVALSSAFRSRLAASGPLGRFLHDISERYVRELGARGAGAFVHDAVAVMSLVRPDLFTARPIAIASVCCDEENGGESGRIVAHDTAECEPGESQVLLVDSVRLDEFYDAFVSACSRV